MNAPTQPGGHDDWTLVSNGFAVLVTAADGNEKIIARFAFEDDAQAFLKSARRRKPWEKHRLVQPNVETGS